MPWSALPTTPAVAAAEADLTARDPVVAALAAHFGPCTLRPRRRGAGSRFERLAVAIVHQQLAGAAAGVIWTRVRALVPGPFSPEGVVAAGVPALRAAGLSGAKAKTLVDLAERVLQGEVDLRNAGRRRDADLVAELSAVWGIGRWTAEMFLIFELGRLDVWPVTDLGVRKGVAVAWALGELPEPAELERFGEAYRPWRSLVAWYAWKAADDGFSPDPA